MKSCETQKNTNNDFCHLLVKLCCQVVKGVGHIGVVGVVLVVRLDARVDGVERAHLLTASLRNTASFSAHEENKAKGTEKVRAHSQEI